METANTAPNLMFTRKQIIWTMVGVMLAMLLGALDQTIVSVAMPKIVAALGGFSQYTWATSIYMITSAVTIPIVGKLTDMYGRKNFYLGGIIIFVIFSAACGLSQNMLQLIVFRGLQGVGGGVIMANAFTVIGDIFAPAERGKYQGFLSAVFAFASVIGPSIGGFLTDQISWHWVFFVNVPVGAIVIAVFVAFFPNIKPDTAKHSLDYPGVVILILMIVPCMMGLTWGGVDYAWNSPQIIGIFIFTAIMLAVFIFWERRAKEPILPLSLFKNNVVAISNIVSFLTGLGMFGAITFIPLFYQGVLGASTTSSGYMMLPMTLTVMVSSFAAGQIMSKSNGRYKILGIVGTAFICVGLFLLSRMDENTSFSVVMRNLVILGIGMGSTMPVFTISIQNAVPHHQLGVATSSGTFIRSFGGAVGLAVLGSVLNNSFFDGFIGKIPDSISQFVSMDHLSALANNPQALVNASAQAQLQDMIAQSGAGPEVFQQLMNILKVALSSALTSAFFVGFCVMVVGCAVTFFMKEIPLRKEKPVLSQEQQKD
jgi:EmrB/QacA subfamily drug resistance transporter